MAEVTYHSMTEKILLLQAFNLFDSSFKQLISVAKYIFGDEEHFFCDLSAGTDKQQTTGTAVRHSELSNYYCLTNSTRRF